MVEVMVGVASKNRLCPAMNFFHAAAVVDDEAVWRNRFNKLKCNITADASRFSSSSLSFQTFMSRFIYDSAISKSNIHVCPESPCRYIFRLADYCSKGKARYGGKRRRGGSKKR